MGSFQRNSWLLRGIWMIAVHRRKVVFAMIITFACLQLLLVFVVDRQQRVSSSFPSSHLLSCREQISLFRNDTKLNVVTKLPNSCPYQASMNNPPIRLGCYLANPEKPLLSQMIIKTEQYNSLSFCVSTCRQASMAYAGLYAGVYCWCGHSFSQAPLSDDCNLPCPIADSNSTCGGNQAVDIFNTGAVEYPLKGLEHISLGRWSSNDVRIVYVFVLTGRSWRHIQRAFRLFYHASQYYYIHVDKKSEYLFSKVVKLSQLFPDNVYVTPRRLNPIWGSPSLLQLLINVMDDLITNFKHWDWDVLINVSETDLPVTSTANLVKTLNQHRGQILIKYSNSPKESYILAQALDKAFLQCENYVWMVGPTAPLDGVIVSGGSDWLVLPREFVIYALTSSDSLVRGLRQRFLRSLLPVESFFHTLALNSYFCKRLVNSNLRLVNWQRPRGCSCRINETADWCGCSPSVFSGPNGLYRLNQVVSINNNAFIARKFDSSIDVAMVNFVETRFLNRHLPQGPSLNTYIESIFSSAVDSPQKPKYQPANLLGFTALARAGTTFAESLDKCLNSVDFAHSSRDVFAFFNATSAILSDLNYHQLHDQLKVHPYLFTNQLSRSLPLRIIVIPDLIVHVPATNFLVEAVQVRFRRHEDPWVSRKPPKSIKLGEMFYFHIGAGFDPKELVFRNYHGISSTEDALTIVAIWRARKLREPLLLKMTRHFPLLYVNIKTPSGKPCVALTANRTTAKPFFYPGQTGFFIYYKKLSGSSLADCVRHKYDQFGRWNVTVEIADHETIFSSFFLFPDSHQADGLPNTTMHELFDMHPFAEPVAACAVDSAIKHDDTLSTFCDPLPRCENTPWSTLFTDTKSSLGAYDSANGLLRLQKNNVNQLLRPPVFYSIDI